MSIKPKFIDSHMHLWDLSLKKHVWLLQPVEESFLGDYAALQQNYLLENYREDSREWEVEKIIVVQGGWDRKESLGEVRWLAEINDGRIGAVVAYANLAGADVLAQLEALQQFALVRGVRQIVAWHPDASLRAAEKNFLQDLHWQKNFKYLAEYNLTFDLQMYPHQTEDAYNLLKRHPNVRVVIEHGLQPLAHDHASLREWESKIKKLAELPNVYIKISGLHLFVHEQNFAIHKRLLETMVEHFTPARCMLGSNFPVEKLFVAYEVLLDSWAHMTRQYTREEQEALFSQTAKNFYS